MAEADYICLHDEVVDDTQPLEICDPDATWKKKVLTDFTARELLVPIFRGGRLVYQKPALDDIRAYCAAAAYHALAGGAALRLPAQLLR